MLKTVYLKLSIWLEYLIHPKLRSPNHPDHRNAVIISWILTILLFFIIIYDTYFLLFKYSDITKNLTNLIGHAIFIGNLIHFRLSGNYRSSLSILVVLSLGPTMYSTYHTGGIYSVDYAWLLLTVMGAFIFTSAITGFITMGILIVYTIILYLLDYYGLNDSYFRHYFSTYNPTHNLITIIFVLIVMAALLFSFTNLLKRTTLKLEKLQESQIKDLEARILEKTDEISKLRTNLAKDFHDEMGNKLAGIHILSQMISHQLQGRSQELGVAQQLDDIGKRSIELFEGTKDFIWAIDFKSDYVIEVFNHITEFGETFFMNIDVNFKSTYQQIEGQNARIKATVGRQVVLACKEIMTNAAKHSKCTEFDFVIYVHKENVEIFLNDNGIGFDPKLKSKRGLNNIYKRVESIGGRINLASVPEKTAFTLLIPLDKEPTQNG